VSARREPSAPPVIPGFEYVRLLGTGGFADVFLYEQQMPRRPVAVKVLLASSLGDEMRERFRHEADLMAQLSHHPSIVTIFHADVAPDGRPFFVMEYCSRPGLGQRYRAERMGVAEVLRIGVRLASAVETAHRAGILHRDIKPANVLVTDFGWPALTDFGIAATTGLGSASATGMSIPWSPPELLAEHPSGDVRADVYSLAATVYSLLARRSPFEVPDGANGAADLIARIERAPLAPTGRGDVPPSLQTVLERAMDRSPVRRHHSALAFARALQQVEAELLLPLTPLDLPEDAVDLVPGGSAGMDGDPSAEGQATRLRPVPSVSPEATPGIAWPPPQTPLLDIGGQGSAAPAPADAPGVDEAGHDGVPESWRRHAADVAAALPDQDHRPVRPGRALAGGIAAVVVIAALAAAGLLAFRDRAPADPDASGTPRPTASAPVMHAVPAPSDLVGSVGADGSVVFTWANPDPDDGDTYLWGVQDPAGGETHLEVVEEPTVTLPPGASATGRAVCVEVSIRRENGQYSTLPAVGCAGG
jgi:serine/threonine protein kinase